MNNYYLNTGISPFGTTDNSGYYGFTSPWLSYNYGNNDNNSNNNKGGNTGLDDFSKLFGTLTGGLQAFTGLSSIGQANKAYKLAKRQFAFQRGLANRNIANQAKTINNHYDSSAQAAAGLVGGMDSSGNYGFTSPDLVDRYAQKAKEKYVDGRPI